MAVLPALRVAIEGAGELAEVAALGVTAGIDVGRQGTAAVGGVVGGTATAATPVANRPDILPPWKLRAHRHGLITSPNGLRPQRKIASRMLARPLNVTVDF